MNENTVSIVSGRNIAVLYGNFVSGARIIHGLKPRMMTQDVANNRINWLRDHGRNAEAERLREQYFADHN